MMTKFVVMVTDLSDGSDFKPRLIALVDSQSQAKNAAENHIQSIIREYAENGIEIVSNDILLRASDESGQYCWIMNIQQIELDISMQF